MGEMLIVMREEGKLVRKGKNKRHVEGLDMMLGLRDSSAVASMAERGPRWWLPYGRVPGEF
jgi:hypothetical protein